MPVVTIDPLLVNLDNLELEVATFGSASYTYTISNHGLIRAEDFQLQLPSLHPTLQFNYTQFVGAIEANTTVLVSVYVSTKGGSVLRQRRTEDEDDCYKGEASYVVVCGFAIPTTSIGLSLSRDRPCSSSDSGSGGSSRSTRVDTDGDGDGGGDGGDGASSSSYTTSSSSYKTIDLCDKCTLSKVSMSSQSAMRPHTCVFL